MGRFEIREWCDLIYVRKVPDSVEPILEDEYINP